MFTRMNSPMLASQFQQKGREYFNNNPNPSNPSPGTLFYQADSLHVRGKNLVKYHLLNQAYTWLLPQKVF